MWQWPLLLFWSSALADTGPPSWPDSGHLSFEELGTGTMLIGWPEAENNLLELMGYRLYATDTSVGTPNLIFDGLGYPTILEFLYDQFEPGREYHIYVVAYNYDPEQDVNLDSEELPASYTISIPVGVDPTTLGSSSYSWVSGVESVLSISSSHPQSGFPQTVGPVCTIVEDASCIVGRNFVAYIDNLCELNSGVYECVVVQEGAVGWGENVWLRGRPLTTFTGSSVDNTEVYEVGIIPTSAGAYSLLVQATSPNSILGIYWENEAFSGEPSNIRSEVGINFNWANDNVVVWSAYYVSARFLGYLVPATTSVYQLRCVAFTYCSVWVDDLPVLNSIETETECSLGCLAAGTFTFTAGAYHRIRVDYVALTGQSFLYLQWKLVGEPDSSFVTVPSDLIHRGAFIEGSPYTLTVVAGAMTGTGSYVYGSEEAMEVPFVGKPYNMYIQVNDGSGNPCTSFSNTDVVDIDIGTVTLTATPRDPLILDCVYFVHVIYEVFGSVAISARVNGVAASNTPFNVDVKPGPPDAETSVYYGSSDFFVGSSALSASIRLMDVYGNDIAHNYEFSSLIVSARLQRSTELLSTTNGCGRRSDFTWKISCWSGEFRYVDDALITGLAVFSDLGVTFDTSLPTMSLLKLPIVMWPYSGDNDLVITFGEDSIVSGAPIVLSFLPTDSAVDSEMCLVQFSGIGDGITLLGDTPWLATVLLRDSFGNVLTDRNAELVEMVVTSGEGVTRFTCSYVTDKYYTCEGYAVSIGSTIVTVEVNSQVASMTTGTKPSIECQSVAACGTTECPCMQTRISAQIITSVAELP